MERLICIAIGYACGLFQTAYILGKIYHIDIRKQGSGNLGSTNVLRTLGKKAGALNLLCDCLKCIAAILIVRAIFGNSYGDILPLLSLYAAAGCILGHNFPFYMNFKGGKGIAATAGVVLGLLDCHIIVICLLAFILCVAITRYVSLGSLIVVTLFWVTFFVEGMHGAYVNPAPRAAYTNHQLIESYVIIFLFAALAFYRHKANIVRLVHGQENKIFSKKPEDTQKEE